MDRKPRIGVLTPFYPPFVGGAEAVAGRVSTMLVERGYRVEVQTLCHEDGLAHREVAAGVSVARHPFRFRKVLGFTDIAAPGLIEAMRQWDVDIVHLHSTTYPTMLLRAVRPLAERGIPVMLIPHGVHETLQGSHTALRATAYRMIMGSVMRRLSRRIAALGACSRFDVERLAEVGIHFGTSAILANGVDQPGDERDERPSVGPLRVLHVASIKPNKGHLDVLTALEATDQRVEYNVVGSGGDIWKAHEAHVREAGSRIRGSGRVVFHGRVGDARLAELYRAAHVVIVPSHAETFPLAVLEGMSHGKPVVATKVGGVGDMIENGVNGLLVEPGEPRGLADALQRLADPEMRRSMGHAATEVVKERFSWPSVVDRYEDLTLDLVSPKRHSVTSPPTGSA